MKIVNRIILTGAVLFSSTAIVNARNGGKQGENGAVRGREKVQRERGERAKRGKDGQQRGRFTEMLPAEIKAQLKGKEPKECQAIVKKWVKENPEAMKKFRETMRAQSRKGGIFTILPAEVKAQLKGKESKEQREIVQKWIKANPEAMKQLKEKMRDQHRKGRDKDRRGKDDDKKPLLDSKEEI